MALDLPGTRFPRSNDAFKSSGEDHVIVEVDGQMTDTKVIFHARGERTNGAVSVMEVHWAAGDQSPHHLHKLEDEGFFVIEGAITFHTPDGDTELGAGEFGWAPRHVRHAYSVGPDGARVIVVQTPGTDLASFFEGISKMGALRGEGEFEEFQGWAEEHYGAVFYDPAAYPPGQSVPDDERAAGAR